jgi:hypothetical protein
VSIVWANVTGAFLDAYYFAVETAFAYFEIGIKHILLKEERKVWRKLESILSTLNIEIM